MSENNSQNSESAIEVSEGIFTKVKNIATSKKGIYLIGAILLIGAIYYYTQCYKKPTKSSKKKSKSRNTTEETEIPEPPPGYVTVPVEMLQGLQDQMYQEVQSGANTQMQQLPEQYTQRPQTKQTQQVQQQQVQQQQQQQVQEQKAPQLRHNKQIEEDDEDLEIANQNLSKDDMESIQAQLNAMQREGSNA
jgi:hypothetical protein